MTDKLAALIAERDAATDNRARKALSARIRLIRDVEAWVAASAGR